jgi:hypothetical protein
MQDVANEMTPADGETYIEYRGIEDARLNPNAINLTFAMLNARLDADPWLPIVTTCSNSLVRNSTKHASHLVSFRALQLAVLCGCNHCLCLLWGGALLSPSSRGPFKGTYLPGGDYVICNCA